jgi:hypothetical protein
MESYLLQILVLASSTTAQMQHIYLAPNTELAIIVQESTYRSSKCLSFKWHCSRGGLSGLLWLYKQKKCQVPESRPTEGPITGNGIKVYSHCRLAYKIEHRPRWYLKQSGKRAITFHVEPGSDVGRNYYLVGHPQRSLSPQSPLKLKMYLEDMFYSRYRDSF